MKASKFTDSQILAILKQTRQECTITEFTTASLKVACDVFSIRETCFRYQPKLSSENEVIADWLLKLTITHKCWGFGLCFMRLRNEKGFPWNYKRVYRIYLELELNLRI